MSVIAKGRVSAVVGDKLTVILPEHGGIVTPEFLVYGGTKKPQEYKPNDFVLVVLFNDELTDGVVLGQRYEFATDTPLHDKDKACARQDNSALYDASLPCARQDSCANCTL